MAQSLLKAQLVGLLNGSKLTSPVVVVDYLGITVEEATNLHYRLGVQFAVD